MWPSGVPGPWAPLNSLGFLYFVFFQESPWVPWALLDFSGFMYFVFFHDSIVAQGLADGGPETTEYLRDSRWMGLGGLQGGYHREAMWPWGHLESTPPTKVGPKSQLAGTCRVKVTPPSHFAVNPKQK